MENWKLNDRLFECCERGKLLKVAVLVSGGVDSSVALCLLCEAGHNCTAFYLKIWFQEDFENFWSESVHGRKISSMHKQSAMRCLTVFLKSKQVKHRILV